MSSHKFQGIPASPGIVVGNAYVFTEEEYCIVKRKLLDDEIKKEVTRFKKALLKTKADIQDMHEKVLSELGKKHARLFYAYLLILEDTLLTDDVITRIKEGFNAEYVLQEVLAKVSETFSQIDDVYLKERERDIIDVVKKLIHNLIGKSEITLKNLPSKAIIIAHNLTPTDTISMKSENVQGFATDMGGRTSHTAILAQSMEIPAVVGLHDITNYVKSGDLIIIDGFKGFVFINPEKNIVDEYLEEKKKSEQTEKRLEKLKELPAVTKDGVVINLLANIEMSDAQELDSIFSHGGQGIGLYRTEYLYLNREDLPTEDEQYDSYNIAAKKLHPYPVTIRTVDLGGDKLTLQLRTNAEKNPFLGLRAIRLCLKYPNLFKTQLRAILRSTTDGKVKIMYPMISCVEELRKANKILEEVKMELRDKKIKFNENIEVGAMIEIPSAAYTTDIIVKEVDFISIGTNDLIQYTFAVDRGNESVFELYQPMHISVLRALKYIIDCCKKTGKSVSMCGEMASDPKFAKVLIGLGLTELSMNAIAIPKLKEVIRAFSYSDAKKMVDEILQCEDMDQITKILGKYKD
jgi:phosphoenolpyruvate-protein phosphotransferase (PTS system enzyme I)